ncbi:hypothetical protein SEA_BRUHMOMENT_3 [Arthrobacter phage BruhMoment]|nr:hypothetical protein SEA_BRUHMOMENT_3 [Arthrobacter phage BruhMoment]
MTDLLILTAWTVAAALACLIGFGAGAVLGVWWWILRPIRTRLRPYLPDAEYAKIRAMFDALPAPRTHIPSTLRKSWY